MKKHVMGAKHVYVRQLAKPVYGSVFHALHSEFTYAFSVLLCAMLAHHGVGINLVCLKLLLVDTFNLKNIDIDKDIDKKLDYYIACQKFHLISYKGFMFSY